MMMITYSWLAGVMSHFRDQKRKYIVCCFACVFKALFLQSLFVAKSPTLAVQYCVRFTLLFSLPLRPILVVLESLQ